jgi:hypothetical protein
MKQAISIIQITLSILKARKDMEDNSFLNLLFINQAMIRATTGITYSS